MRVHSPRGERELRLPEGGPALTAELRALEREGDPALYYEGLLALARRQEAAGRVETAAELYAAVVQEAAAVGAVPPLTGDKRERPLRINAQEGLDAILGRGAFGPRAEFLLRNLAQQSSDPAMLFAMGTAGAVFRMTRLATLSRLASTPNPGILTQLIGAGRLASLAGFALEAPAFTLAGRLGNEALGRRQDWSGSALGRDFASSYLVLGGLKLAGWASGAAYRSYASPVGAVRERPLQTLFQQGGMLGGILLGHALEEQLGLRRPQDGATTLTDSLAMLLQFSVAGRLTCQAFGNRFAAWERGLDLQAEALTRRPFLSGGSGRMPLPALRSWAPAAIGPGRRFHAEAPAPERPQVLMMSSQDSGESGPPSSGPRPSGSPSVTESGPIPRPLTGSRGSENLGRGELEAPDTIPSAPPEDARGAAAFAELLRPAGGELEAPVLNLEPVERSFGSARVEVNAAAGYENVRRLRARMAPHLPALREALAGRPAAPWFIAGVSDGMGLHSAVALMEAGVRHLVGGFYEPEALIRMESPVHLGRLANVEGLRLFARERGVDFQVFYQDLVLPQHGKETRPFPAELREAIQEAQRRAGMNELNFVNSIAFARWISPSPGVEQRQGIPSLDLEGRVVLMNMRPYQAKGYEGTLDSMGRNHGALLTALGEHFGPASTSFFFTWAGGSQNRRILHGVYGGGALGHAKEIGEVAALRHHLQSQDAGFARGYHKIVRFPDFPSFALFGIPGGGAFGMVARHVLEGHGCYADMGELAPRAYIEAFGGEHNLRNPAAQIELDVPESYHLPEIRRNLQTFYDRVAEYRRQHPEWDGSQPLDLETSRELLRGLVGEDYVSRIPQATE
ncbi:MAG: hypothetical protein IT572_07760 [Deltaproteobacteria bacterium]|nr:hypothetical protein [Deltaproteobacteria bacterium]